jgi:4-aminobutyrate aminotransferase-like enzyme
VSRAIALTGPAVAIESGDTLTAMSELRRGDLLPRVVVRPPGPRARALARRLRRFEAPGINTWVDGEAGVPWLAARGANVIDVDGNRYLDLTSGFGAAAVGHRHPRVVAAVRRQAAELLHGLGDVAGHPGRAALAERLARLAPFADAQVYFAVSGADAVEIALKSALLATGRPGIVAFAGGYHGLTLGALAATSRLAFRRPFAAHLHRHVRRLPFGCPPERVAALLGGAGALLVEPILGREGVVLPPPGWLPELERLCRRAGTLLVADEVFTGGGRTGWFFALAAERVVPDLVCCGKALGGGLPIGAVLGRREVLRAWETGGEALHTGTFVAHPLACAAALAVLEVLRRERLVERARRLGEETLAALRARLGGEPGVVAVRGRGLLFAVELDSPRRARSVIRGARERGLLLLGAGPRGSVLELVPPLTIGRRQLAVAVDILAEALACSR